MSYCILARNPANDFVMAIMTEDGEKTRIATYPTENEADEAAVKIPMCHTWPYCIVEAP